MPGTVTSMPNSGLPCTTSGLSTPRTDVPMILKSFGSLSRTAEGSGGVSVAAAAASSPYVSLRPLDTCVTAPDAVRSSLAGTPQALAAARTIISRPAAPTRRSGSQLSGAAVLPPANCGAYFAPSAIACSIRTFVQSTSSSSAISIGSMVFTPWPISGFLAVIVTMPSGITFI